MRITKTLERRSTNFFFCGCFRENITNNDSVICTAFTTLLIGQPLMNILRVKITVSSKNPKRKGFKKIYLKNSYACVLDNKEFDVIGTQFKHLHNLKINVGDYFWMKGEIIN